jgi:hypothetical protein
MNAIFQRPFIGVGGGGTNTTLEMGKSLFDPCVTAIGVTDGNEATKSKLHHYGITRLLLATPTLHKRHSVHDK